MRYVFAYCAGIEDKGTVSVGLVEVSSGKILWAYSVNKHLHHKSRDRLRLKRLNFVSTTFALLSGPTVVEQDLDSWDDHSWIVGHIEAICRYYKHGILQLIICHMPLSHNSRRCMVPDEQPPLVSD